MLTYNNSNNDDNNDDNNNNNNTNKNNNNNDNDNNNNNNNDYDNNDYNNDYNNVDLSLTLHYLGQFSVIKEYKLMIHYFRNLKIMEILFWKVEKNS